MGLIDLLAITPFPAISVLIWLTLIVAVLYLSRSSAHKLILIVTRALHDAMRSAEESAGAIFMPLWIEAKLHPADESDMAEVSS